jgi:hypothetical protein
MIRHLSSALILTMLTSTIGCFAATGEQTNLEEGTPVRLKLLQAISSKTSSAGEKITLAVIEDVTAKDGKSVLIKESAPATAFLTNVDEKEASKGGKLSLEITSVKAVDGSKVLVRGVKTKSGHGGAGVATYVIGGVLLGVVGLGLVALVGGRGKNVQIPAGSIFTAYVDRDTSISPAQAADGSIAKPGATTVSLQENSVSGDENRSGKSTENQSK